MAGHPDWVSLELRALRALALCNRADRGADRGHCNYVNCAW